MKNVRTEIRILVRTFVGDDIGEADAPDAIELIDLKRVTPLGPAVSAADVARGQVAAMLAGGAPVISERIAHELHLLHQKQPSKF